ncbi:uncharacterized BrkB/YihY/UPF0761 family membrane protein [Luteibacter sp. Sphag1AF]|uniref:hypothetical protein n=1 Tax=Luteibacter sp. Sphag1AF TaxID=2587031 RepID=UPI00160797FF|nr:hypothetical protein [Luteibacter sp. Sphag1AF]MBB3227657.1 uncharacterized BrkB/YihY/UPF0761 family membrane protein [Luteibacter sp. Sphag1AF]
MALTQKQRLGVFLALALVMAATRMNHFGALPDASWAVFFLGGFWLRGSARWAFPLLMAEAVLVDFLVITNQGLDFWSHYCVSAAYWFLVPAYFSMWMGGSLLARFAPRIDAKALGLLAVSLVAAVSVCYLISNGSFYWLSNSVPQPRSMGAWMANLGDWYLPYLRTSAIYVGIGAVMHVLVVKLTAALGHQHDAGRAIH